MLSKKLLLPSTFALASAALLTANLASAHTNLKTSSPANGTVLAKAPKTVDLEFGHPARLTRFKLMKESKEIAVPVDLGTAASTTFKLALPALQAGRYEAKWSVLSDDGHPMTGSLSFTVSGE